MSYNQAFNISHDTKKISYCETIDPDDNHGQDQDCIDYDPDPLGGGSNIDDHEQNIVQKSNLHGKTNDLSIKESTTDSNSDSSVNNQKPVIGDGSASSSFQSAFIQSVATTKNPKENDDKSVKKIRSDPVQDQKQDTSSDVPDIKLKDDPNENSSNEWHTVGIFSDLNAKVTDFIPYSNWPMSHTERIDADNIPNLGNLPRISLEPGTAYRFRLRAINTFGVGEPGEASSFKTCLPGFPGAPSSIKISKSLEGAHLVWQPPALNDSNEKLEFTVYLAIKSQRSENELAPGQLAFVRVYSGINSQCLVTNKTLASAHVDYSSKPAIIFRIAAKNIKGYGPATQVRWLQDSHASPQQQQTSSQTTPSKLSSPLSSKTKRK